MKLLLISLLFFFNTTTPTTWGEKRQAENFSLPEVVTGKNISLSDFKDSKAIVILFIATQCPISNDYNERMAKLFNDYQSKNIAFVGINSNKQEPIAEIIQHAKDNKLGFTILKDDKNLIADKFGAQVTPEIYVIDPKDFKILYHGRIDDGRNPAKITKHDLRVGLDELLSGGTVTTSTTKAFGCTIKRIN